jgi:hypothetical protein
MRRISPGEFTLEKITGNAEPLSEQIQNISRFDCSALCDSEEINATAN